MAEERVQRRLAAILAADVVGYSRLMGADEEGTLRTLNLYRGVMTQLIEEHQGRVVDTAGDSLLAEFGSAVQAVRSAVAIQQALDRRNADLGEAHRMRFRIGINVGDVMVQGSDVLGEGVNIAARLEQMAEPDSILVSGAVWEQVEGKLSFPCKYVGEHTVKNIARPVRTYQIGWEQPEMGGADSSHPDTSRSSSDKPSIAVLPFTNMSGDPEQQYFSDGITEDITTELSRFREFIVIARHSSFRFRDSAADVKRVGRELGVRYVVEGSVRRIGDSVRITAQLIDAVDDVHLWAERYDRSASEIFAIQHEVVQAIVGTFAGRLEHAARERAKRRPTNSLAAYECFLRAHDDMWRLYYDTEAYLREGLTEARGMCNRAIEFDPRYARAHACLAFVHVLEWLYRGSSDELDRALACARTAVSIDSADDWCHATLGLVYLKSAEHDRAEYHMQKAVELNPNDADTFCNMGLYLAYVGSPLQAIEWLQRAMRLNPFCPDYYPETLGMAYYLARRFDDAVAALRRMRKITTWGRAYLAACYAQLDRLEEARAETAELIREARAAWDQRPPDPLTALIAGLNADLRTHKNVADYQLWLDGMRKAGLPI
ncbi:MAG: adenylate/guanylate cyclase domain-containing protein [Rhodospirillales bacterium]|nr:adenylate/guanylate cyclase domain-containing protein [Rhodospirillales bacterium]